MTLNAHPQPRRAPFAIEYWPELFKCVQGRGCSFSRRNGTEAAEDALCIINHTSVWCVNGTLSHHWPQHNGSLFTNGTAADDDSIWNLFGVLGWG